MAFTPIDESAWERREYLQVFRQTAIYLTAEVDITVLYKRVKNRGERLYPALIWCVAAVLNRHAHFRYGRDEAGRIGIWDVLHPYYTVPRREDPDQFAMKVTPFTEDYQAFLTAFQADYARAEACGRLLCDETLPPNICGISAVPGLAFSAFSFGGDPKPDFTCWRCGIAPTPPSVSAGTQSRILRPLCCWGRSTRRESGWCCRWAGNSPTPSTTAATSAAFSRSWRRLPLDYFQIERKTDRPWGELFPRAVFCLEGGLSKKCVPPIDK